MTRAWVTVVVVLVCAGSAAAQSAEGTTSQAFATAEPAPLAPQNPDAARESVYDRIWRFTRLYRNEANPVVQQVLFSGRYQQDFALLSADQGSHDEWNVRRLRLGPRITLFRDFTFHAEMELNPQEHDPLYVRLTDFYLQWTRNRALTVTAGKHGVPFTMDGATSSKDLITIDRSNLTNNFWFTYEYLPGVSLSGSADSWVYRGGVFSSGEATREFGRFDAGTFVLGALGYDFGEKIGVSEALLSGNYVYQEADPGNTFTRPFEHVTSVNVRLDATTWGVRADVSAASGYLGQSDLWGAMAMPYVNLTPRLQLVARYTHLDSEDPNGVRLATYENEIVSGRGDRYDEWYVGANYYVYGHRLKVQSGVQHADMDDRASDGGAYSGTSWVTGLRIGW
jgi:phosphate-selective porin OprO/OprP